MLEAASERELFMSSLVDFGKKRIPTEILHIRVCEPHRTFFSFRGRTLRLRHVLSLCGIPLSPLLVLDVTGLHCWAIRSWARFPSVSEFKFAELFLQS